MKPFSNFLKQSSLALFGLGLVTAPAQAINITTTSDANTLANTLVGSGITINSATYSGASVASGTFTGGLASGIGIDKGILLTSGSAVNAVGPNDEDGKTTNNGTPGDVDLNGLIPGFSTNDAASLVIDFTTTTGDIFFNYVFASEEYNEFVNSSFNDVFGFFLDGVNIALIPGTTTPVSINNVNGGNPVGSNASNSQFFVNNDLSDVVGPLLNIQYDGFTKVLTAKATGLSAGSHKIKLAIADAGDSVLDSGVFIQAGTLSGTPTTVPEPATLIGLLGLGAFGVTSLSKRQQQKATKA